MTTAPAMEYSSEARVPHTLINSPPGWPTRRNSLMRAAAPSLITQSAVWLLKALA